VARVLAVGLGNPLYGDDGFGSCLAQYLMQFNDFVYDGDAHGVGLLGLLSDYDVLVFVDVDASLPPGAVAVERIEGSLTVGETRLLDAHRVPPSLLVGYLRAMGRDVEARLVAVGPASLELLSPPSRQVLSAARAVLRELEGILAGYGLVLRWEGDPEAEILRCYERALGARPQAAAPGVAGRTSF
jgi:hydrogenase maturation protease